MTVSKRIDVLDSIRGLASFSVVVDHAMVTLPLFYQIQLHDRTGPWWARLLGFTPLHALWAGHEAVILFYVLSGFVLALPYVSGSVPTYAQYVVKRLCRIYVPYFAVVSISALLMTVLCPDRIAGASAWFNGMWADPISLRHTVDLVLMLGASNHNFNTATWSLVHEMRISIAFPFLMMLVQRFGIRSSLVFTGLTSAVFMFGHRLLPMSQTILDTGYYAGFFVLGALLAKYREPAVSAWRKLALHARWGLMGVGLLLYTATWLLPDNRIVNNLFVTDWAVALGTVVFICAGLAQGHQKEGGWRSSWLLWLGRVSYSLYLVHPVVLLLVAHIFSKHLPLPVLVAIVPPLALGLAEVTYRYLEKPAQLLGGQIAGTAPKPVPTH